MTYRHSIYTAAAALLGATLPLMALLSPATASAHGSFPLSEAVTGVSTDEQGGGMKDGWVLKSNFGLITSNNQNRYICEESFSGGARFNVAVLGMHEWVIFTEDRIVRTEDGCDFTEIKSLPRNVADYAADPDSGKVAYVMTGGESGSELWVSEDRGESFSQISLDIERTQLTQIEFISGGRIFASAYINENGGEHPTGTAVLLVIGADGVESRKVVTNYKYPYVQAARGDQVGWLAGGADGQVMIWGTVDEPEGASHPLNSWPTGAAFNTDGTEMWVAGVGADGGAGGFLHATRKSDSEAPGEDSVSFEEIQTMHSAGCVGFAGDTVYACARRDTEDADLQRLVDGSFENLVNFNDLEGPRQDCPADSDVGGTCPAVWPELEKAIDVAGGGDAGSTDAGMDAGPGDTGSDAGEPTEDTVADAEVDGGSGTTGGNDDQKDGGCSATGSGSVANPILILLSMLTAAIIGLLRREEPRPDDA